ncbi:helix-turn-helix transcriptional regulator [Streptomyces seoulensis]|uniref:helix-turn-helix transcriptional regulator n=1 Tax=Streptomyces seoulensis TaxID=73044 RepID=UPI000A91B690|nr:helix-turn-helix transcriptional regulator [Streptomyces seoulensis]
MSANLGQRLRDTRKRRGLSQRELSKLSGVPLSLIRKLAHALKIPTTQLVTEHAETPAGPDTANHWAPVHTALTATPQPTDDAPEAPTYNGVRDALHAATPLFSTDRFDALRTVLPPLLRDTETLTQTDPRARPLRARLLELTGWLMTQTRQFDAAELALERALDHVQAAATINTQWWLLLRRGKLAQA